MHFRPHYMHSSHETLLHDEEDAWMIGGARGCA